MSHPTAPINLGSELARRVCAYFAANPDEALSSDDIAIKWDAEKQEVATQLKTAVLYGLLNRSKGPIYSAGPRLENSEFAEQDRSAPAPPATPSAKPARRPGSWATKGLRLDIAALPIRTDIPLPSTQGGTAAGGNKWDALFERLTDVGMCAPLPVIWRSAISKACTVYQHKTRKRFAVRLIDAKTIGLFRIEGEFKGGPPRRKQGT